ncbi:ankyrin repeat-containing domain protein [Haematococcus lacustris]
MTQPHCRLLEFRDHDGRTPLIVAAARNHEHCVQLTGRDHVLAVPGLQLLEHGASVHFMNYLAEAKGDTALHEAARNGDTHAPVCDLLLRYGANPFLANSVGRTPLEEAMQAGSFEIMDKMREKALWLGMVAVKVRGGRKA